MLNQSNAIGGSGGQRQLEIPAMQNDVEALLNGVAEDIGELRKRLGPVLRAEPPTTQKEPKATAATFTPMGGSLCQLATRMRSLRDIVQEIISLLEI